MCASNVYFSEWIFRCTHIHNLINRFPLQSYSESKNRSEVSSEKQDKGFSDGKVQAA